MISDSGHKVDVKTLRVHRDRLMDEKAKLATELNKTQNLLRL